MKQLKKEANGTERLTIKNEIIGLLLLFFSLFLIFSFISYNPSDPSFFEKAGSNTTVTNYAGRVGAELSALFFKLFGYASYIPIVYLIFLVSFFFINRKIKNIYTKSAGYFALLISLSALLANVFPYLEGDDIKSGGVVGYLLNELFTSAIKPFFTFLLFLLAVSFSSIFITKFSFATGFEFIGSLMKRLYELLRTFIENQLEKYRKRKRIERVQEKYNVQPVKVKKEKTKKPDTQVFAGPPAETVPKKPKTSLFPEMDEEIVSSAAYTPPPLSYLDASTSASEIDFDELEDKKNELSQRLTEFRIKGEIMEYTPGPVVTTYEFVPDTGVKVKDVTNLSEDLALVVKAQYVRIERVLGKKAIGIEIPNNKREIIHLREVLESDDYKSSNSPLSIALGKSKSGDFYVADLREMPHLIIAGATGSGKSVAIHTILLSILYKSSPDDVKLILIDPKQVELAIYNVLPHLLTPVVVQTKLAKNALDWAVWEMEERYKKLAKLQVRHIDQYNKKLELLKQSADEEENELTEDQEKMPYIVIVIDEFADLMLETGREIENSVARIAQKARAVGIHLILATQRPSTDVITGTIKNNFPSRIALSVPSKFDSRTIIDVMGAEKLLGHGDMLFLPPKTASLIRVHCAYVSEEEALRVAKYLSKLAKPEYNTQIVRHSSSEGGEEGALEYDALFFDAAELVIQSGQASASFLQRRMSVGYARAGRLMDQLVKNGIVSEANSKNQRDILLNMDDLDELKQAVNQ